MTKKKYSQRKVYSSVSLNPQELSVDPFELFSKWFQDAAEYGIEEPNAMVLITVGKNYRPSARMVLLKETDPVGFVFFTNYESRKGMQIRENAFGALLFPWHSMQRQVRIEGIIERLSESKSDEYFQTRPIGSQITSWVSPQSNEIPSREFLEERAHEFSVKYEGISIPRPSFWGGYKLIPEMFEFWIGRENRLHDRFEYYREDEDWKIRRLAP